MTELCSDNKNDVLKINVDGGDLTCLQRLDLYRPKLIILENKLNDIGIVKYLESYGYKLDKQLNYCQYFLLLQDKTTTQ